LKEASPEALEESRSTVRALLRDYRDRAAQYLDGLRNQMSSTAQALREMVEGLSQIDTDHSEKLRSALAQLREVANSPEGSVGCAVVRAAADSIEQSLEPNPQAASVYGLAVTDRIAPVAQPNISGRSRLRALVS
jgi:hypothetical protein